MEPKHRELLRAQRLHLCEQLVVDDTIVQYLYQEDILTEGQVEEIQSQKSNKNKTLMLLNILPNRGPRAFNIFVQSLEQDFPWIKEELLLLAEGNDDDDNDDGGRLTELSDNTGEFQCPYSRRFITELFNTPKKERLEIRSFSVQSIRENQILQCTLEHFCYFTIAR